jgi:hypothetical protein
MWVIETGVVERIIFKLIFKKKKWLGGGRGVNELYCCGLGYGQVVGRC